MANDSSPMPPPFGCLHVCLSVADVSASRGFYAKLGFRREEGEVAEKWLVMERDGVRIGLFQGFGEGTTLNFRGGDVPAIAAALQADGLEFEQGATHENPRCGSATLLDPDGHRIFFDTAPSELPAETG